MDRELFCKVENAIMILKQCKTFQGIADAMAQQWGGIK